MNASNMGETSFFAHLFSERGTDSVARAMWEGYKALRTTIRQDRLAEYAKFYPLAKSTEEAYDKAVSLHNGANSMTGKLMNDLVAFGLKYLLSTWDVEVEQKVRVGSKRDIDQKIVLPKGDIYISTTTIPAERKDATWKQELNYISQYVEVKGIHRPYKFIGIFAEGTRNCSLEQSVKVREKKQQLAFAGTSAEVVCLQDVQQTAAVLKKMFDFI